MTTNVNRSKGYTWRDYSYQIGTQKILYNEYSMYYNLHTQPLPWFLSTILACLPFSSQHKSHQRAATLCILCSKKDLNTFLIYFIKEQHCPQIRGLCPQRLRPRPEATTLKSEASRLRTGIYNATDIWLTM